MARLLFYGVAPVAVGAANEAAARKATGTACRFPYDFRVAANEATARKTTGKLPLSLWLSCCSKAASLQIPGSLLE